MIRISNRLRPFSHLPRSCCLIPTKDILVEAYPALVKLKSTDGKILKQITLDIEGPLKQFTVMQDLERGCVTVFSEQYRFHILPNGEISYSKNPHLPPLETIEHLFLGSHKKQEWEAIKKRCDFRELFPIWFRLGSLLSLSKRKGPDSGIFYLLKQCKLAIDAHKPEKILPAFHKLFLAGFHHFFVPRSEDDDFQAILPPESGSTEDLPLYLLTEGAELIRSCFLLSSENEIAILPNLPPEFFSGKMVHLNCSPYGMLDMEWTKKTVRRLVFRAEADAEIYFHFPSPLKRYRVRRFLKEKGMILTCGEPLVIKSGSVYLLDQFQK